MSCKDCSSQISRTFKLNAIFMELKHGMLKTRKEIEQRATKLFSRISVLVESEALDLMKMWKDDAKGVLSKTDWKLYRVILDSPTTDQNYLDKARELLMKVARDA